MPSRGLAGFRVTVQVPVKPQVLAFLGAMSNGCCGAYLESCVFTKGRTSSTSSSNARQGPCELFCPKSTSHLDRSRSAKYAFTCASRLTSRIPSYGDLLLSRAGVGASAASASAHRLRSYTPSRISVRIGTAHHDLQEASSLDRTVSLLYCCAFTSAIYGQVQVIELWCDAVIGNGISRLGEEYIASLR